MDLTFVELKCSLCKELYNSPVILGCGHSFCKICLDKTFETQLEQKCPSCQERLKPGQKPMANTLLANLVSRLEQQQKELCETHGEKKLFFCMDCKNLGCIVCKDSTKHLRHNFLPLQEAEEIFKNKVNGSLCSQERRYQHLKCEIRRQEEVQQLKTTEVQMERNIKYTFQQLHLYIESTENQMSNRLRQDSEANAQAMERNLLELQKKKQRMEKSISQMQSKRDTKDARDFLANIKDFLEESSREQEEEMKTEIRVEAPKLNPGLYGGPIQYMAWEKMTEVLQPGISNIVLNPETAHPALCISDDLTTISCKPTKLEEENHETPKRYNKTISVFGSYGFTSGKHYWMVDVGMGEEWILGMAKESCMRKEELDLTPERGYWAIKRSKDNVYSALSSPRIELPVQVRPGRIGVYVDYEAGQVSFYNMNGAAHMYTFTDNFTESLYPFLSPCENETSELRVFHLKF